MKTICLDVTADTHRLNDQTKLKEPDSESQRSTKSKLRKKMAFVLKSRGTGSHGQQLSLLSGSLNST